MEGVVDLGVIDLDSMVADDDRWLLDDTAQPRRGDDDDLIQWLQGAALGLDAKSRRALSAKLENIAKKKEKKTTKEGSVPQKLGDGDDELLEEIDEILLLGDPDSTPLSPRVESDDEFFDAPCDFPQSWHEAAKSAEKQKMRLRRLDERDGGGQPAAVAEHAHPDLSDIQRLANMQENDLRKELEKMRALRQVASRVAVAATPSNQRATVISAQDQSTPNKDTRMPRSCSSQLSALRPPTRSPARHSLSNGELNETASSSGASPAPETPSQHRTPGQRPRVDVGRSAIPVPSSRLPVPRRRDLRAMSAGAVGDESESAKDGTTPERWNDDCF